MQLLSPERVRKGSLLLLATAISVLFLWMIREFLLVLLLAALTAGALYRPYRALLADLKGRATLAAALTIALVSILVVVPLISFASLVASQAVELGHSVGPWLRAQVSGANSLERLLERYPELAPLRPYRAQILERLSTLGAEVGTVAVAAVTRAAQETATFLLLTFVMLYATFFFLIGGRQVLQKILYYSPLPPQDEEKLVGRFLSVARATVKGTFVVGFAQGALGGLGFWVAGIQAASLWATMMGLLSILPGLGPVLVWLPAVLYLVAVGRVGAAVALFLWCALVVGTVDNVLRPWLVGKDTKMPDLMILLSTLGGIVMFGALGVIVGPIVAALFITIWDIYGEVFRELLPEPTPLSILPQQLQAKERPPDNPAE